ncbi:ABC transporter ATP-binding protein [Candidatus Sumerlaeota bacterium]
MPDKILEFNNVSFSYKGRNDRETSVLDSLSFHVHSGEIFGLVGPSGCGKTTILKLAADLVPAPTAGRIAIDGISPAEARAERRIAILFQRPILLNWRNVIENILLPVHIVGSESSQHRQKAKELLALAGMEEFSTYQVHELSGGMQQRVSLVRCLMTSPRILLLDEPFAALDEILKDELLALLQGICHDLSLTVVYVSHSLEDSILFCDRVAVLDPRPTTVSQIVSVPLGRPRTFSDRLEPDFLHSLATLRTALRQNGMNEEEGQEK